MAFKTKSDTITRPRTTERVKEPSGYTVVFLNDNFTPMDYVIEVLVEIFDKDINSARNIMMRVHSEGRAAVGTYTFEIADQKIRDTDLCSERNGYPLKVIMEKN